MDGRRELEAPSLLHRLCEAQAQRTPGAWAVLAEDELLAAAAAGGVPSAAGAEGLGATALTYRELEERAARLARALAALGVGPETPVALHLERSPEALVALLGVLKAGGVCVPLDPALPVARAAAILRELAARAPATAGAGRLPAPPAPPPSGDGFPAGSPWLLTRRAPGERLLAELAPAPRVLAPDRVLWLDEEPAAWPASGKARLQPAAAPATVQPDNLAYLLFTSGSSGTPKGVAVSHLAAARHFATAAEAYGVAPGERVLQFSSWAFDAAFDPIFTTLARGGTLVLRGERVWDPESCGDRLGELGIQVADLPTAFWARWAHSLANGHGAGRGLPQSGMEVAPSPGKARPVNEAQGGMGPLGPTSQAAPEGRARQTEAVPAHLRLVIVGGERLAPEAVREWQRSPLGGVRLLNAYGPTEAVVTATLFEVVARREEVAIGTCLPGRKARLLAAPGPAQMAGDLCGDGDAGELALGGAALARGYWLQPDLTAERFVPDPLAEEPGARLYRTGDLVRRGAGEVLEFLGRTDRQIKVRGFRIEPEEIEAALRRHPRVLEAAVVAGGPPSDLLLVACLVPAAAGPPPGASEIRSFLRELLPEAMLPAAVVHLPALPLGPAGKVDYQRLAALCADPAGRADRATGAGPAPVAGRLSGPFEELVAGIWQEVLGIATPHPEDDFFDRGGHSLAAAQVISRLRRSLGIEVTPAELFDAPTLAAQARLAAARGGGAHEPAGGGPPIPHLSPAESRRGAALSFAQEGLWFLDRLHPASAFYNLTTLLHLDEPLDLAAFAAALQEVVRRHEVLRTSFPDRSGRPFQVVAPMPAATEGDWLPRVVDLAHLCGGERVARRAAEARRVVVAAARKPFDLAAGVPLRALLLRLDDARWQVLLVVHHIASDGWSQDLLLDELASLYRAASARPPAPSPLAKLPLQYADFAAWQRRRFDGEDADRDPAARRARGEDSAEATGEGKSAWREQLAAWKERLAGMPPLLDLPADRPRPPVQSFRGGQRHRRLPAALGAGLRRLARRQAVTLHMVLVSAFATLLHRRSGQEDLALGSPAARRARVELEGLIGFFVDNVVLRTRPAAEMPFTELLEQVRWVALDAYGRQEIPFEKLVEELRLPRSASHGPLVQAFVVLQPARPGGSAWESRSARVEHDLDLGTARGDLMLVVEDGSDELPVLLEYASDLFDASTAVRLLGHFETLLEGVLAEADAPLSALPLLCPAERHQLAVEWCRGAAETPSRGLVPERFAAQAALRPLAPAVASTRGGLTYGELDSRAERLAGCLRRLGVGPEVPVAILSDCTPLLAVALLAVWKAGGAFLLLEPGLPPARLSWLIQDALPAGGVLLREQAEVGRAPLRAVLELPAGLRVVELDASGAPAGEAAAPPFAPPLPAPSRERAAGDLACLIYTSGTTGRPKAVQIEHGNLAYTLATLEDLFGFSATERVACTSPLSFDLFLFELLAAWLSGGTAVLYEREPALDLAAVASDLPGLSLLVGVPAFMRQAIAELRARPELLRASRLRNVLVGGEAVPAELLDLMRETFAGARIAVVYGPTETTMMSAVAQVGAALPAERRTIGRPLPGTSIELRDPRGGLVPVGVPGELWIGGPGVARGYLSRPELSTQRFTTTSGCRWYRTGDLARWLPEGELDFLGRGDGQVKVRGFRVELGEIESVLASHPLVQEAAVTVRPDPGPPHSGPAGPAGQPGQVPGAGESGGSGRLVAYVVRASPSHAEAEEHLASWRELYDDDYAARGGHLGAWRDNLTGQPVSADEMREWIDVTMARLLALSGRRVLEVGCGSGLLVSRLAPRVESYLAADFSRHALDALRAWLRSEGRGLPVTVLERPAHDWSGIAPGSLDLVILNSVAQYFPSAGYLGEVLAQAARAVAPGGKVFLGDVRSLPLLPTFHCAVALRQAPAALALPELRRRVRQRLAREEELVVDPRFFDALRREVPAIASVEVLWKRGRHGNEMVRFAYDVVIAIGPSPATPAPLAATAAELDWVGRGLTLAELDRLLAGGGAGSFVVRGIPNALLLREAAGAALLEERPAGAAEPGPATAGDLLAAAERAAPASGPAAGASPEEVCALAERHGFLAEPLWEGPGSDLRFTAVCWRPGSPRPRPSPTPASPGSPEPEAPPPALAGGEPLSSWTTDPLGGKLQRQLPAALRRFLSAQLPGYMVPSAFVLLDRLPRSARGKVDRSALPEPELDEGAPHAGGRGDAAPRTPEEKSLAALWAELLGRDRCGIHDNFFELGGHSLLASQLVARLRERFGVQLPVRRVFQKPTVAELALELTGDGAERAETSEPVAALPRPAGEPAVFPASPAQRRLWFVQQLAPDAPTLNVEHVFALHGALDVPALWRALAAIVARHEPLRSTFSAGAESAAGAAPQVMQRIAPPDGFPLPAADLRALPAARRRQASQELALAVAGRPFDLARGPLARAALVRLDEEEHWLIWVAHHLVFDGWSLSVFHRELGLLYAPGPSRELHPPPLPRLHVQYGDLAVWQQRWLAGPVRARELAFWRRQLEALPNLELATDRPRRPIPSGAGGATSRTVPAPLARDLAALCQSHGVTLYMALLAAFELLLGRHTGQTDFALGSPVAGRTRPESEELIGMFSNTLVLRADLSGGPSFATLLARTRETALDAYAHQELPFEVLVEELQPQRHAAMHPFFQVAFSQQESPPAPSLAGLRCEELELSQDASQFDLTLIANRSAGSILLTLNWKRDLFESPTPGRLLAQLSSLLEAAVARPGTAAAALPLWDAAELHQLTREWNDSASPFAASPAIPELIAAQARRQPGALAVAAPGIQLTYAELAGHAAALARRLRPRLAGGPEGAGGTRHAEPRVAILFERSPEQVVAALAVLSAGGAYLPLDPAVPPNRLRRILADSGACAIITSPGNAAFDDASIPFKLPREDASGAGAAAAGGPPPVTVGSAGSASEVSAGRLAYVIYTSGSTGMPKGVEVSHGSLQNLSAWYRRRVALTAADRATLVVNPAFDASVLEIWPHLAAGASLHIPPPTVALAPRDLLAWLEAEAITLSFLPTPLAEAVLRLPPPPGLRLRALLAGGDRLLERPRGDAGYELINIYGPTEATVTVSAGRVDPLPRSRPSIGRPLANTWLRVLDEELRLVPLGGVGELCIGGAPLARCYGSRPELTAERFVPDPLGPPGARLYRTGDLVRYLPGGELDCLGRRDSQVKIRGYRIELGEIESCLARHPAVQEAAASVRAEGWAGADEAAAGSVGPMLVAYVVPRAGAEPEAGELRSFLREQLPEYMVPSAYVVLDRLPLTSRGKLDRGALPAPAPPTAASGAPAAPTPGRLHTSAAEPAPAGPAAGRAPAASTTASAPPLPPLSPLPPDAVAPPRVVASPASAVLAGAPTLGGTGKPAAAGSAGPPLPPARPASQPAPAAPPAGPAALEVLLATLWREALGVPEVGRDDNFFDLGGHSFALVGVHERLEEELGTEIPLVELFENTTIRHLAVKLTPMLPGAAAAVGAAATPVPLPAAAPVAAPAADLALRAARQREAAERGRGMQRAQPAERREP